MSINMIFLQGTAQHIKTMTWMRSIVFSSLLRLFLFISPFIPQTSCNHDFRAYKDGDVIVGGLLSIRLPEGDDHCGNLFTTGLGHVEAIIFAIESINKNPVLLSNVTLGYDIRNYCFSTNMAVKIAYDFMQDNSPTDNTMQNGSKPISVLIGPDTSASAVLVGSFLQVVDIPAISSVATSVDLSSKLHEHFFRTVPPDIWQAKVMADIIELFNWTYVAAVGLDDSYGRNGIWALEKESYNRKTFCVAFSEHIPRRDYHDKIKQTVAKIKLRSNIGVIVVWLASDYGREFFREATSKNLVEKTWILSDALTSEEAVLLDPNFAMLDGSLGIQPHDYPVPDFEEHLKIITPAKSLERGREWWEEFWRIEFNCSAIDLGRIPTCKSNLTLHNALKQIRNSFVSYDIDAVYAIAHALDNINHNLVTNRDSSSSKQPIVKGRDLQKYLRNVSFDGLTGKVQFDMFGDPLSASYDIINFRSRSTTEGARKKIRTGVWDREGTPRLNLNVSGLQWKSLSTQFSFCSSECLPGTRKEITEPCCWECKKCLPGTISTDIGSTTCAKCEAETKSNEGHTGCEKLPIVNITFTTATGITITLVAFVGIILTLLVCGTWVKFYNTPVVKASSREISLLLLFGISAVFILAVLELVEPSKSLCSAATFWRYFALNICITVLFLKTMRIASVFEVDEVAQLFAPCYKNLKTQIVFLFVMNLTALSLLALWIVLDPPRRKKIIRSDEYIFIVCKPFDTNIGLALFITVCSYTLIVALFCTYYAFKARGIPENFNETKYIGFSMYILLLSSIAYYPVAFAFDSWYVTLVSCSTALITSFGLLGCMFGPKLFILLFRPQQNSMQSVRSQVMNFSFNNVTATRVFPAPIDEGVPNVALE